MSWTKGKKVGEEGVMDKVIDTLCWVKKIRKAYFHGAVLVFNLLEEGVLVVVSHFKSNSWTLAMSREAYCMALNFPLYKQMIFSKQGIQYTRILSNLVG